MASIKKSSELILNEDGTVYHLNLLPEHIADTVITVGDPSRVAQVSKHFDTIDNIISKREFITHTGKIGSKSLTVLSTGIGPDNIDIVLNELHILASKNLSTGEDFARARSLNIIRIGTSGTICDDIEIDSFIISKAALGLDNVLHFYKKPVNIQEQHIANKFQAHCGFPEGIKPYYSPASAHLISSFKSWNQFGITLTAPGFYGPQGRGVNLALSTNNFITKLQSFSCKEGRITNIEMESATIFGLCSLLGHRAISANAILANRATGTFSKQPRKTIEKLIKNVLETICSSE